MKERELEVTAMAAASGSLYGGGARRPVVLFATAVVSSFWLGERLWAIPSPDLVINFFASAAQVLGLLTVLLGGAAFAGRGKANALGARARVGRAARWPFRVVAALLLISVAANVLQYARDVDARNRRLRANLFRSSKENGKRVGDVSLKTLSFSDQVRHPRGVSTEDVAEIVAHPAGAEAQGIVLLDVREPEEVEMGWIRGSRSVRYPDLRLAPERWLARGRKTILLCYSGNRSSELCDEFAKAGYDTRFMVGGYEKWIAEGKPLVLPPGGRPDGLREIADFPNKDVLLDTPDVERLVREEGAIFVDVRYPGDFELGHLPGAINLPIRKMPTEEMWRALKALPRKPIIVPCYDKRSSFYALILGLRLHRLGYDFLGRYTVPHEYVVPVAQREHVARWIAGRNRSLVDLAAAPLRSFLGRLEGWTGSLAFAILAAVLALRILVAPLTLKADRDQILLRSLAPEIRKLRERYKDDPQRASKAILKLHRSRNITPARNLAGTLLQVVLFLVFFAAVNEAAQGSEEAFLWVPALGQPDPLRILPFLVGALILGHLELNAAKRSLRATLLRAGAAGILVAITYGLKAALNVYLAANIFLLLLQTQALRRYLAWRDGSKEKRAPVRLRPRTIVPLRLAHHYPGTGNKARRLGEMLEAGLPVPDGFAVTCEALFRGDGRLELLPRERREIDRLWRRIGAVRVAVRSSGLNEDGADKSYAGVFESILNVEREGFEDALEEVRASLNSARASAYSGEAKETGGVLVQTMVDAEYAGVLFTEHPAEAGTMLVELVEGLGEALVSGAATPRSFRYGRVSGRLLDHDKDAPPIDLTPLIELGRRVERLYGAPQDIEWAYAKGRFFLLQSRHITTSSRSEKSADREGARFERERHRLLETAARSGAKAGDVVFAQNELSELLPRPTPLSLSFMETLWGPGGSTDIACRSLGIPYDVDDEAPPYLTAVFGALYVNRLEERRRTARGAGAVAAFRLARSAPALESELRGFLEGFLRDVRIREALDLSSLSDEDLFELYGEWTRRFVEETYVVAERINIAADFFLKSAERDLRRKNLSAADHLSHIPETVVHKAMAILPAVREGKREIEEFLELFGHRAPHDYELAAPRYRERPELVEELARRAIDKRPASGSAKSKAPALPRERLLAMAVERARRFQQLKEEAKHHALRELSLIRKVIVEIGRRTGLEEEVFFLTWEEVARLREAEFRAAAARIARERLEERSAFAHIELPAELRLEDIESLSRDGGVTLASGEHGLKGAFVAGSREVQGVARVITDPSEIESFADGEILVARFTDPSWTPLFPRAKGIVTEVGGWLSHAAIVAREYDVPAVVGVRGAMQNIRTGDIVRLRRDGGVEVLPERRKAERRATEARVALVRQGEILEAMLHNLSATGALVEVGGHLKPGQGVRLRVGARGPEVEARVVRADAAGRYGVRFEKPAPDLLELA